MDIKESLIKPLLERAGEYCKTSFELLKLKFLDKAADISSSIISRLLTAIIFLFFVLILSIAIALWIGDMLGKNYYGFFIVASFYGLMGIILLFIHPQIKARVSNSIITHVTQIP